MQHRVKVSREIAEEALQVPGVAFRYGGLLIPDNAIDVVRPMLRGAAPLYPVRIQPDASAAVKWLRPGVVEKILPFQREGIAYALSAPEESALLVHPTGAGKTLEAIVWSLARPGVTVVVTKAAVVGQWAGEVKEWSLGEPVVLEGRTVGEVTLPDRTVPTFFVLSYSVLAAWAPVLAALRPTSVVFDEIPKAKAHGRWDAIVDVDAEAAAERAATPGAPIAPPKVKFKLKDNTTAAAMILARAAGRRLGTTATPIQDRVRDLWAQLDLIQPKMWGAFWPWARRYAAATEGLFGMEAKGTSHLDELQSRLRRVAHFVPKEIVDAQLPAKRRRVLYVRPEDQSRPDSIAREIKAAAARGKVALLEMRLMEAAARKRRVVVDMVIEALASKEKVVVFTGRRVDAERLGVEIEKADKSGALKWMAHGGHTTEAREEIRQAYMAAPGPACLVGTGDAWGEGLNLQDTDLAVMAMLPYTPGQVIQREGRFQRIGMKRPVLIAYVIAQGTVDEHVAAILLQKLPAVEKIAGSTEAGAILKDLIGDEEVLVGDLVAMLTKKEGTDAA